MNDEIFVSDSIVDCHIKLKQKQVDVLKTIDENISNAARKVIEYYIKQKTIQNRDKLALNISLGLLLIGFGLANTIWYVSVLFYGAGVGGICYGLFYYFEHKRSMR